jgi:hypothetical protein
LAKAHNPGALSKNHTGIHCTARNNANGTKKENSAASNKQVDLYIILLLHDMF